MCYCCFLATATAIAMRQAHKTIQSIVSHSRRSSTNFSLFMLGICHPFFVVCSDRMMHCLTVVAMCEALDKGRSRTLEEKGDNSKKRAGMYEAVSSKSGKPGHENL